MRNINLAKSTFIQNDNSLDEFQNLQQLKIRQVLIALGESQYMYFKIITFIDEISTFALTISYT